MGLTISEPIKAPIPVTGGGQGKPLGELALSLATLEVGMCREITGATPAKLSSAAVAAGKRENKKFAMRKTTKIVEGQPVYGIWRLE